MVLDNYPHVKNNLGKDCGGTFLEAVVLESLSQRRVETEGCNLAAVTPVTPLGTLFLLTLLLRKTTGWQ